MLHACVKKGIHFFNKRGVIKLPFFTAFYCILLYLLLTYRHIMLYNLITKKLKEVFIMIKLKEFHIRISLYYKGCKEAFKLVLLKTTSLADARTIADALEEYYKADYSTTEII